LTVIDLSSLHSFIFISPPSLYAKCKSLLAWMKTRHIGRSEYVQTTGTAANSYHSGCNPYNRVQRLCVFFHNVIVNV